LEVEHLPTQAKIDRVQALKEKIERSTITLTADYTGISVNEMNNLRKQMRDAGVEFTVVKNTLMHLASEQAQRPNVKEIVQGPTALALGYDDPLAVAKAVADYIRINRSVLAIRGAVMGDGPIMGPAEVNRLAALPPKPQLLATLLGQLQSPIRRLLGILNGPLTSLDGLLQARIRQLESQDSGA
jgi:large subunit ribosomal protein L10